MLFGVHNEDPALEKTIAEALPRPLTLETSSRPQHSTRMGDTFPREKTVDCGHLFKVMGSVSKESGIPPGVPRPKAQQPGDLT